MKVTVVPAQVTTVEDRIAGNLGLSQILLLVAPIFIGSALYVVLPPNMHSAPYKLVVIAIIMAICSVLSIRIKGKIVLLWLVVLLRYNLRPRLYLYNKNTLFHREPDTKPTAALEKDTAEEQTPIAQADTIPLSPAEALRAEALLANPASHLSFETSKKGGLYVRITEIKQEG